MAEYFPLLERAVAGLQDATPDSRRAIYDRARNALLGQLRAMQPAVPEADIERESQALDEAITRLEERFKERPRPVPAAPAPARPAAGARPPLARAKPPATPPGLPVGKAPPVAPPPPGEPPAPAARPAMAAAAPRVAPPPRPRPAIGSTGAEMAASRPSAAARPSGAAARTAPSVRPSGERVPRPLPPSPVPSASAEAGAAAVGAKAEGSAGSVPRAAPRLDISPADEAGAVAGPPILPSAPKVALQNEADAAGGAPRPLEADAITAPDPRRSGGTASGAPAKPRRSGASRPAAPRPAETEPRGIGFYVVSCVVFVLVVGIAVAAWRLRDRPEQVTAAQTATSAPESPGKIVDRVGGDTSNAPPEAAATGDSATTPPPVPQGSSQPAAPATPDASTAPAAEPAATPAPLPVSQRAALLVDAPEDPQKVKTYVGSVVWRSESVSPGQGQPLSNAVRADVDIPDAKLTMSMVLKKNLEPQFPASHTMEFHFTEMPGNALGPVKQINVPEMRKDDSAPTGDPLTGVPVSITDDYFLVGLSRGAAEASNLQLMSDRNWIDVSILLKSGKVAKITFEKGATGQRILEDALKSWQ